MTAGQAPAAPPASACAPGAGPPRALRWLPALLPLLTLQAGCFEVRYALGQAGAMIRLMQARRPVEDVLADPRVSLATRRRLRVALDARQFGIEVLGLSDSADFTRFTPTSGPVGYNLTVAKQTRLELVRFGFGVIPYLGFFSEKSGRDTAAAFQRSGHDTYLRPFEAFSGLGLILSPIYSEMLDGPGPRGELRTVENILHEMAHCTVPFIRGGGQELAEPFATVVGLRGSELYFRLRGRPIPSDLPAQPVYGPPAPARPPVSRDRLLAPWLRESLADLRAFYKKAEQERWPRAEILKRRDERFAAIEADYRQRLGYPPRPPGTPVRFNNATLLSLGVYHAPGEVSGRPPPPRRPPAEPPLSLTDLQAELLKVVDGDLRAFVALYKRAQERRDTTDWLRAQVRWHQQQSAATTALQQK